MDFFVRNKNGILGGVIILISTVGMIKFKSQLEEVPSLQGELYFNICRGFFFLSLGYLIIEWVFDKWKAYKILKDDKMSAELLHLKNQINPHFFFNTLNTLYGLIRKDPDNAREFVLKLSDLMRYSVYGSDHGTVSIEKEVLYLENFIDLNKIRFKKEMDFTFKKEILDNGIKLHPLLLIVLLENAFKHGVEMSTYKAHVNIVLEVDNDNLFFEVTNNFDPEVEKEVGGIGLQNLRKRLDLLYQEKYNLVIESKDDIFRSQLTLSL